MRDQSPNLRLAKAGFTIRWLTARPSAAAAFAGFTIRSAGMVASGTANLPRHMHAATVCRHGRHSGSCRPVVRFNLARTCFGALQEPPLPLPSTNRLSVPSSSPTPTRAIALLELAGFSSQAMVRAADSLLPQIATDIGVTVGAASIIVTAYAFTHGTVQLIIGPIGDRFGKFLMVAIACALCSLTVMACGLAQSLTTLALARIASGLTAAWIIPLGMAFVGDVVPYERRQEVLGRYLTGQISGQLFGQAAGGIIGDWLGWRAV